MAASINVLAELERVGLDYKWANETSVKVKCPFHADDNPSCVVYLDKPGFKCFTAGCAAHGDILTFLARLLNSTRAVIYHDLSTRYQLEKASVINADTVERYHAGIWQAEPFLRELRLRGITDDDIRQYRIGEDRGRITIPIKNAHGLYVNVRRYLPGAPGAEKMRNTKGHGQARLFPIEQLEYNRIVICGGELKAIAAAKILNRYGIGAITHTGGEGNWSPNLSEALRNKDQLWICYDIDKEGQTAASTLCNLLSRYVPWISNVTLPLDADQFPHGDINDFVAAGHDLYAVIKEAKRWESKVATNRAEGSAEDFELARAFTSEASHKRLRIKAVVSAMDQTPYVVPSKVLPVCSRDQKCCGLCPVYSAEGVEFDISPESASLLDMVGGNKAQIREANMLELGIPKLCRVVDFETTSFYNIEDVRLSPELEMTSRNTERAMLPAICIGKGLELNETYYFTGRMHPHPRSQQSTLVISSYDVAQDALSSYQPANLEQFELFQPTEWSGKAIQDKLNDLYEDLSANVTRIFQRNALHLVVDLVFHSPLFINFDGRTEKGWAEALIVGDSSQGKSETTKHLMHHYGLGTKVECKNASVAGLLGGLQQINGKWFVTWGVIPTHDKRLVVLEELKGASREIISKLTDMRSSGIAEIPKIEKRRTHARTRLIALSNPRSNEPMSAYNYGIEVIPELVGGLEDVRRFDVALVVATSEIDARSLNRLASSRPEVEHTYTSDLCRGLILWAWTRDASQVVFESNASEAVLNAANELCEKFTDAVPLVDRGSMRTKLARLSAAIAARTFSTTNNHTCILVRTCHVEFIKRFLISVYSADSFGYDALTKAIQATTKLKDPDKIKHQIESTPFPKDVVDQFLHTTSIELQDVQDWCGWDRNNAMQLVSFLVRKHALVRDGRAYRKTPEFIKLLKTAEVEDRPEHIPEEEF